MKIIRYAKTAALCLAAAYAAAQAQSDEALRTIDIYVSPYYASADTGKAPQVNVNRPFDALLASTKREDILKVRDAIAADPALITPMTMMVLAIRLYDVGERDEGVFWHYAAKNRFYTLVNAVDEQASGLSEARHAMNAFVELSGPYFNSYAFCDRARQQALAKRALDWAEAHPYAAIDHPQIVRLPGDSKTHIANTLQKLRAAMEKENAKMNDPEFWAAFQQQRRDNNVDKQFCW